ncbi:MAG TPA: hypothetical protein VN636_20350 [Acidimicrobiia bacterium]|nr:hypothetical protein [Acidimicrobiia bacterium]
MDRTVESDHRLNLETAGRSVVFENPSDDMMHTDLVATGAGVPGRSHLVDEFSNGCFGAPACFITSRHEGKLARSGRVSLRPVRTVLHCLDRACWRVIGVPSGRE